MNITGWRIKPFGWIVLAITAGLTICLVVSLFKSKKKEIAGA